MMLTIENVSMSFGRKRVLDTVSFAVERGQTVALMGPNGAGKTTILRCVLGLLRYEGQIGVGGWDAQRHGVAARKQIGYVPQSPTFYDMTAREVVRFVARLRGVPRAAADVALCRVGLDNDAGRRVCVFSGGMQQRLSLAAALIGDPPLLLLDEPTANLDPAARVDLLDLLSAFRSAGKTLVLSSHRPREVRGLVDRVILLNEGRLVGQGAPVEVLPPDRIALSVQADDPNEKSRLAGLLFAHRAVATPTRNGTFEATLPADAIVPVVECLREAGVARHRIALRPIEEEDMR